MWIRVLFLFCLLAPGLFAQQSPAPVASKSIFSLSAGVVTDTTAQVGWSMFLKNMSFLGTSPWYYGFGSTTGSLGPDALFETSALVGWNGRLGQSPVALDLCLNLVAFGGRVEGVNQTFRSEAPAFQPMLGLAFPAAGGTDVQLTVAPLWRPFDAKSGSWTLERSYLTVSAALRFKTYLLADLQPWSAAE